MNLSLPFYGQKGTISRIQEEDKYFLVYRYDINGKENFITKIAKTTKNYNLLLENYYSDLKDYLSKYGYKYEEYKMTRLKKKINMNLVNLLKLTAIIMITSSIPLLLTHEALGYLGVVLDVLSIPVLVTSINLSLKDSDDKRKAEFINKYNDLEHRLRIYNDNKEKTINLTKYKGLKTSIKEPERDLTLIKEMKKAS